MKHIQSIQNTTDKRYFIQIIQSPAAVVRGWVCLRAYECGCVCLNLLSSFGEIKLFLHSRNTYKILSND